MTLSLAASENVGGLHAAIADRLAPVDDARREWLNRMVHGGGICRYCGRHVSDSRLVRTPGVCSLPACRRRGIRDAREQWKAQPRPATPVKGEDMPKGYARGSACKTCGSTGTRHKADCAEADAPHGIVPRETKAPKSETKAARVETIRRAAAKVRRDTPAQAAGLTEMSVPELLELRDQVQDELERREEELAGQLKAIRGAKSVAA